MGFNVAKLTKQFKSVLDKRAVGHIERDLAKTAYDRRIRNMLLRDYTPPGDDQRSCCHEGTFTSGWFVWTTFFRDVCHVELAWAEELAYGEQVAGETSWTWYGPRVVAMGDHPVVIGRLDNNQMHNDQGPALGWRDGWNLWCVENIEVDEQIVMRPETQTVDQIENETDADRRRIRLIRFGYDRYLRETGAEVIDTDVSPHKHPRALYKDKRGGKWLQGTDGSTARVYLMPVPATANTCREAHEAISGFPEDDCFAES